MNALWTPVYVGIGANLDEPEQRVREAFDKLGAIRDCRLIVRSGLFRTAPLGPQAQPDFINAVAGLLTQLTASELLTELKSLERALGRDVPLVRWGPRRIDFDLLVFGREKITTDSLTVPHPGVPSRNFVLYPLRTIAPDLDVPGHGRVSDLAALVTPAGITALA